MTVTEHLSTKGRPRSMWFERGKPNPESYASGVRPWANHHILPIASVGRSIATAAKDDPNLLKAIKHFTEWNINAGENMIRLPTRRAYENLFGKLGGRQVPVPSPGLACHSWAHMAYNDAVADDLVKVFNQVKIKIEGHEWSANDVSGALGQKQGKWKGRITGRKTTIDNWRAMRMGVANAHDQFTMVRVSESPF